MSTPPKDSAKLRKPCDGLRVLANQVFLESLVNSILSVLVTQAAYSSSLIPSSLGHACPSSVVLQPPISLGTLAVDDQASLMAPVSQSVRDWFHLDRLRLYSLCLKEGCYVALCRFSASATLTLILSAPHPWLTGQAPRDSLIACVKLFPNSRNPALTILLPWSLTLVTRPLKRPLSVCCFLDFPFLCIQGQTTHGYLLFLLGHHPHPHHYLTPPMGSRFWGPTDGSILLL